MHRFWHSTTLPILEALEPRGVAEIGSQSGAGTRKLIEFCRTFDIRCHIIDPIRPSGYATLRPELEAVGEFHETTSLKVLPKLGVCDAFLIDGDHNWYTVYHELELVHAMERDGHDGPLCVLHDVCWPYGRRDMYYNPTNIPPEYRNPWARRGLDLDSDELCEVGGMNRHLAQALRVGGERNGVRTGVERFIERHAGEYRFTVLPVLHGLGFLYPARDDGRPYAARVRELCDLSDWQLRVMELVERQRLELLVRLSAETSPDGPAARMSHQRPQPGPAPSEVRFDSELQNLRAALAARDQLLLQIEDEVKLVLESRRLRIGNAVGSLVHKLRKRTAPPVELGLKRSIERIHQLQGRAPTTRRHDPTTRWEGIGLPIPPPQPARSVTVVVPVYNAFDETRACVESLARHHEAGTRVLLIDDASPDERIWPLLQGFAATLPFVTAEQNPENLGYTRTINRAIAATRDDIILLNSDTRVTHRWVSKLQESAYSRDDVATVTPLSNAAGAFSIPRQHQNNELPLGLDVDGTGRLLEFVSDRQLSVAPTSHGFCTYIRRDALDRIGLFDEKHFPRGHGEENDFSMRAIAAGRVNLIDDGCFVFHSRSASFGDKKTEAMEVGKDTLARLHPEYKREVKHWLKNDPLERFRTFLTRLPKRRPSGGRRSTLLYIVHDGRGGTRQTTWDLAQAAARDDNDVLVLATGLDAWTLSAARPSGPEVLEKHSFDDSWRIHHRLSAQRARYMVEIVATYGVDLAHFRHFLGNAPELLELLDTLGVPTVVSFHDFYCICPTIQMVDNRGRFCAGRCNPGLKGCTVNRTWFPEIPTLKNAWVHVWRRRVRAGLQHAAALVTTSVHARELMREHYPLLCDREFAVIEHGRDLDHLRDIAQPPRPGEPLRVVTFGALNFPKGTGLLQALLDLDQNRGRIELHVLGGWPREFQRQAHRAIFHGSYNQANLVDKIRRIGPAVSLVPSICAETFCHTLTESWAMGLPVLASDLGALHDRISRYGGGWLRDPYSPELWYAKLCSLADDPDDYEARRDEALAAPRRDVPEMYLAYRDLYQRACLRSEAATGRQRTGSAARREPRYAS